MKIEIKIEGEDIGEIVKEIGDILENNRNEIKKLIRLIARETIDALEDKSILEKGATLYINLNREINYKYRKGK
ncbi:MAG TPA: hypothetical protein ENI33_05460 [Thermoplasmatales archaeon]|nr:hypothetical protein [Thermoplasmatales archaeon]HEC88405.1 hypothetical protein [Thermoplasmata archaeon]